MNWLPKAVHSRERGAVLIIVLAFVVLLTGVAIAYLSRATSDRQVAHSSFNQSNVDQLAQSAMDNIIGDLRQEIVNGSTATIVNGVTIYTPTATANTTAAANMIPQRSGNAAGVPNLIRRSVRSDPILSPPGLGSRASGVNSTNLADASANGRYITSTRWNSHYLVPKGDTGTDDSSPIPAFTNATPDWVFVTSSGATPSPAPANVIGRYAYAVYDEGGLLDMNVAGYPTSTTTVQSGRKGSVAFANLTGLGSYGLSTTAIDAIIGWRNCASAQPDGNFPDFTFTGAQATNYVNSVLSNTNGFMTVGTNVWQGGGGGSNVAKRTDQNFVQRQELIGFRKTTQFSANTLQYLSTFSRETNSPSFSPSTPSAINPNFLLTRVTATFVRFDGTTAVVGEPLVKTRFPLRRLAWITYKGPSSTRTFPPQLPALPPTDPNYDMWSLLWTYGVPQAFLQAGTAITIQKCFGLTFGGNTGDPWTYSHGAANRILRLDEVAAAGREPDFFELLQAGILNGSLGQNTGGGVTGQNIGGAGLVFPDIHMSSTTHHILTIGACIIDQADPDSIPMRIQFTGTNGNTWTAYGVENLPYITQLYPIAGVSPNNPINWATYLLFQLWNPHQNAGASAPSIRLRVDGGIGIFTGGNGEAWNPSSIAFFNANGALAGQNVTINPAAFSVPAPLTTANTSGVPAPPGTGGTFNILAPPPAVPAPTP
jgi:Tfp pilus assembly protein PilX